MWQSMGFKALESAGHLSSIEPLKSGTQDDSSLTIICPPNKMHTPNFLYWRRFQTAIPVCFYCRKTEQNRDSLMMCIDNPRRIPLHPVVKFLVFPHKAVRTYLHHDISVQVNRISRIR